LLDVFADYSFLLPLHHPSKSPRQFDMSILAFTPGANLNFGEFRITRFKRTLQFLYVFIIVYVIGTLF